VAAKERIEEVELVKIGMGAWRVEAGRWHQR
jgi:hypothetical protein